MDGRDVVGLEKPTHARTAVLWEDVAWPDFPAILERCGAAVLWPFGATEQHGPHLGTGVDSVIARSVCEAVSARCGLPVLPTLPFGVSSGHSRKWPGTLSLSPATLGAVIFETGNWLVSSGVRRIFLVNAHVTNSAPIRCGLEMLRDAHDDLMVALINTPEISPRVGEVFSRDAADWHANAAETALMMVLREQAVVSDRIADADDEDRTGGCEFAHRVDQTSRNGVTGSPTLATRAMGEELFDWMVNDLTERVRQGCRESRPIQSKNISIR